MLRWFIYVSAAFLIIDHAYTHWGPQIINGVASSILGRSVEVVKEPPHKESIVDKGIRSVREAWERIKGGKD
jgi:hypothetical protein